MDRLGGLTCLRPTRHSFRGDNFVAAESFNFNKLHQSSASAGIWFGTRISKVPFSAEGRQTLSPRPLTQRIRYLPCIGMSLATLHRVNASNRSGAVINAGNAAHPLERPPGSGNNEWLMPGKIRTVTSELPPARIADAIFSAERTGTVASAPP